MGKIQVKNYSFDASAKTVTFNDYVSIDLDSMLLITNVTSDNAIIYNFAGKPTDLVPSGLGGTISGNVLTLAYDTTSMSDSDKLQIWYWDTDAVERVDTGLVQGLTDAQLRATPVPVSGTVSTGLSQPLTDAQLRATTVPISGTVSTGLTQPLTDTQLRASAVAVSGTFWQATQPVSGPLTDTQLRATAVPISGTVSTGLAQPLTDAQLRATPVPVSGTITVDTSTLATSAKQDTGNTSLDSIDTKLSGPIPVSGTFWQATQPVSGPLTDTQLRLTPVSISGTIAANAGTDLNTSLLALEAGGNLASIKAKTDNIPALGQALAVASVPVVLTAVQLSTLTPPGAISGFATEATLALIKDTDGIKKITDALPTGSNVIGHVIADSGSTTVVTGNVTVVQGTASNLKTAATLDAETTKVIGTVNIASSQTVAVTNVGTFAVQATLGAETTKVIGTVNIASSQTIAVTNTGTFAVQSASTLSAETTKVIGTVNIAGSQTIAVTNTGTFAVQSAATLAAETTKVIGVVRNSDGAGNLLTSNSTTYTAKFGLDSNLLGTLGTAFTTAGKVDIKAADGDAFVRQTTASNLNMTEASAANILTKLTAGVASMVKLEDVASNDADAGVPAMAVRKATPANTSGSDGDYEFLQMSAGALWVAPLGVFVTVSTDVTRQAADTTTYTINDALSDSTSAPTSGGFTFTGAGRKSGGSGIITDAIFTSSAAPATLLSAELWIFNTSVTAVNDNVAFTISDSEVKTAVAMIPFTLITAGPNSLYHAQNLSIGFTCSGTANLRFLVKVKNAYIPVGSEVLTFTLKIIQID